MTEMRFKSFPRSSWECPPDALRHSPVSAHMGTYNFHTRNTGEKRSTIIGYNISATEILTLASPKTNTPYSAKVKKKIINHMASKDVKKSNNISSTKQEVF